MKAAKYFLFSFLLVALVCLSFTVVAQEVAQVSGKEKVFTFLKEIDTINIVLLLMATFAGGMWGMLRMKLKQLSDLFLEMYTSTDENSPGGKKVVMAEREKIISRVMAILSKSTVSIDAKKIAQFKDEADCKERNG